VAKNKKKANKGKDELSAVEAVYGALESLGPQERSRVLASVQALMQIPGAGLLENAAEKLEAEQSDGRTAAGRSSAGSRRTSPRKKSTNGRRKSTNGRRKRTTARAKSSNSRKTTRKSTNGRRARRKKTTARS